MEKKQSLSVSVTKGRGSLNHNNREFVTKNVDTKRIKDNITYTKQAIEEAYDLCFGKAVEEYDERQKRKDRKIGSAKDYLEKIRHSGNKEKEFYEIVVQVGNMQDCPVGSELGEVAKKILDDYMLSFSERNPNLYVFNAVMHLDEKTPHLHIDYIPIARGYKQGMMARNSLDKALKEMGVEVEGKVNKHNNRNKCWQEQEKNVIEDIMGRYDIKRTADKGLHREHMTVDQYKATVEQIHNEVKSMPRQIEESSVPFSKTKVMVEKSELEKLEKRSRLSMAHEKAAKELIKEGKEELKQIAEMKEEAAQNRERSKESLSAAQNRSEEILSLTEYKAEGILRSAEIQRNAVKRYKEDYIEKYNEQLELNERYEKLQEKYEAREDTIDKLNVKIERLTHEKLEVQWELEMLKKAFEKKLKAATEPLNKKIEELKDTVKQAYGYLACVVKAAGMLVYSEDAYRANLTTKQRNLIDALSKYVSVRARDHGFDDIADDVDKHVNISNGILELLPKEKKRDKGMSR